MFLIAEKKDKAQFLPILSQNFESISTILFNRKRARCLWNPL